MRTSVGFCSLCPELKIDCFGPKMKAGHRTIREHHRQNKHEVKKTPGFSCGRCLAVFGFSNNLGKHICVIADKLAEEAPESFKDYQMKSHESSLVKAIFSKLSPYHQYSICYEEKYCIKDLFPPIFLSGAQRSEEEVKKYGHSKPTDFVIEVLLDQQALSEGNGIMLDGRINVKDASNNLLYRLPDKYLSPKSKKLHVEPKGCDFFVSLVNVPEKPKQPDRHQFPNPEDSIIYDQYVTDTHVPHSYNRKETRGRNLFLEPAKISARLLGRYVGMSCE